MATILSSSMLAVMLLIVMVCLLCMKAAMLSAGEKPSRSDRAKRHFQMERLEARLPLDSQIGTVTMPYDGYLSAGVYDSDGHLVRTLFAASPQEAGSVPLVWDGRDDYGRTVTASGTYTWKALYNEVQVIDQGGIGDSLFSPSNRYATGQPVEMSEFVQSLADGPNDGPNNTPTLYMLSRTEEGPTLVKFAQDGTALWASPTGFFGSGIATDDNYVYYSGYDFGTKATIVGRLTHDGVPVAFPTPIAPDRVAFDDFESGTGGSGGNNWSGSWSLSGSAAITGNDGPRGAFHVRLSGNDGVASRQVNLRGAANIHLAFEWKRHNFAAGDSAVVEVYNGTSWQTVFTLNTSVGDGDNYTDADVDLNGLNLPANFQVRFRSLMPTGSGAYASFDNIRTEYNSVPSPNLWGTTEQMRKMAGTLGMASNGTQLFVANYRYDAIDIFDTTSGQLLNSYSPGAGFRPLGIAIHPVTGRLWIANSGDRVTEYTYAAGTLNTTDNRVITGLSDPGDVDFGGADQNLFIAESGASRIARYTIPASGSPTALGTFGSDHASGTPLGDSQFKMLTGNELGIWGSLAVDSQGVMSVRDVYRVQRFNTEGQWPATLYQSWQGQWSGAAVDTYGDSAGGRHFVLDSGIEYEVDPDYTGGARAGWLGDGTWRVNSRYYTTGVPVRRNIWDASAGVNRELVYGIGWGAGDPTNMEIVAYTLSGGQMKRVAIVGAGWRGIDLLAKPDGGQYVWTDTDGDGLIEGGGTNGTILGSGTDGEITWYIPKGQTPETNYARPWVDDNGNIWISINGNAVRLSLIGFNGSGIPQYSWSGPTNRQTVAAASNDFGFVSIRPARNGEIFGLGSAANLPTSYSASANGLGAIMAHYDSSGNLLTTMPTPSLSIQSLYFLDDPDGDPEYVFGATGQSDQQILYMFSEDGLLVTKFGFGAASSFTGGWVDHPYGVYAFKHAVTGEAYVYAQDVWYGKSERYKVDNMESIGRSSNTFSWTVAPDVRNYWSFDGNLSDTSGTANGTVLAGVAAYSAGKSGNALTMDGNDTVAFDSPGGFDSYTISFLVKPTSASAMNILSRSAVDAQGQIVGSGNVLRIQQVNGTWRFVHAVSSVSVNSSTVVSANTWYHVAMVLDGNNSAKLYINGTQEGGNVTPGGLFWNGNRLDIGSALGGFSQFNGQIEELHVFKHALSGTEIAALAGTSPNFVPTRPTVSAVTTDAVATETSGNTGTITISRNSTGAALTVNYLLSGSATNGSDYSTLSGSATIPSGSSSVVITITPTDDSAFDIDETITLRLVDSENYVATNATATVTITDNDAVNFSSDPGWTGLGNSATGNAYGYSAGTSHAGNDTGEIGGTFARNDGESYYADTDLKRDYSLDDVIKATGKFTVFDSSTADGEWFLGHMTSDANNLAVLGIQFFENGASGFRWRARVGHPGGAVLDTGVASGLQSLANGDYNFEYTYDPTLGYKNHGRLTVRIWGGGFDQTATADLASTSNNLEDERYNPSYFDTFGIGIRGEAGSDNSGNTVQFFADDLNYTGKSNPTGLPTVSINATDNAASEAGPENGVFTVTRTGSTSGSLAMNYTIGGSANNGSDYSSITGSVTIADGQSSATITIAPIDDSDVESPETVILTLSSSANYTIGAGQATVTISSNDTDGGGGDNGTFSSDPAWTGYGNTANGQNYGYSATTGNASGSAGEIGGRFARTTLESYYADTNLTQSFDLTDTITGSGRLHIGGQNGTDGNWFLGHLSSSTSSERSMIGIEFAENTSTSVRFYAKAGSPNGANNSTSNAITLNNGAYNYSYTYNPSLGSNGRLTVRIYNDALTYDQTNTVDLSSATRSSGAEFDAFGIGTTEGVNGWINANEYIEMHLDNVSYSGQNTAATTVNVTATDNAASESGPDNGVFTITRTGSSGDLTVSYTISGTATSGSDYSSIGTSVVIPNGSTSVTVTVAPLDDTLNESIETVILTLSSNANYTIGSSNSATINIASNDPLVTVTATDATAAEVGSNNGVFTFSRNNTAGDLTVFYSVGGTATSGSDFSSLSGSVTIPNGSSSATVTVTPVDDNDTDVNETVVVTVSSNANYSIGTPNNATVTITDNDPVITVAATDATAAETGSNNGVFTITRNNTTGNVVVDYTISGSATAGADYAALSGSVTIASGQSTATVTVIPIDDAVFDVDETVVLTIASSGNYSVGSPNSATVTITDNETTSGSGDFTNNPNWAGSGNTSSGNNFGWTNTSNAGGSAGEIGGTFARTNAETHYADTSLSGSYSLVSTLTAAGKLSISGQNNMDGDWALGHLSTTASNRSFMGIRFLEQTSTSVRVSARMGYPGSTGGSDSTIYTLPNGVYNWTYTYDPTANSNLGRLTVRIYNDSLTYDQTIVSNLTSNDRNSGATFNAFGIGSRGESTSVNASQTIQMFVDNVTYTGQQSASLPTVTIAATDPSAAEAGPDNGVFTVTRTGTSGNLVVNYTVGGTATGTGNVDYTALSGSVTIANGSSTATITVAPVNDSISEGSETVILTLASNSGYVIGGSGSATVTIADNDVAFASDPVWTGYVNTTSGNSYGWSNTNNAGGSAGEIGGKFARNTSESYYADTNLSQSFDLTDLVFGSGRLNIGGQNNTDGNWFLGHLSSSTSSERSMIGIEFAEYTGTSVRFYSKVGSPNGANNSTGSAIVLNNGTYNFTYTYDPSIGSYGRLTTRIYNDALTYDQTNIVNLSSATRSSGAAFDAFGIGITEGVNGWSNSNEYIYMYVDNVSYSGYQKVYAIDGFESAGGSGGSGWAGAWTLSGDASVTSGGSPANGSYHLQLTGNTGSATRAVNLDGVTDARLEFNWKANSFESADTAVVEIYDGTSWLNVLTIGDGQDDNVYHFASLSLADYSLTSSFQVRIRSLMSAADDLFYVDDLRIVV